MLQHGYDFVLRYVRRQQAHAYDITAQEASILLSVGLGLGLVQHVESTEAWIPTPGKGLSYGLVAGQHAKQIGVPRGAQLWCDLEGVAEGTDHRTVIEYLKWWYDRVATAGYIPCLYVGWHCGLTAVELYHQLPFAHYWSAYNLNADEFPAVRGVCLRQHAAIPTDRPPGISVAFDVDVTETDAKGGQVTVLAPDGWLASLTG